MISNIFTSRRRSNKWELIEWILQDENIDVKRKVKARQIKTCRKRRHQKGAKWKCYCTTNEKEILGVSLDPRSVGVYK